MPFKYAFEIYCEDRVNFKSLFKVTFELLWGIMKGVILENSPFCHNISQSNFKYP